MHDVDTQSPDLDVVEATIRSRHTSKILVSVDEVQGARPALNAIQRHELSSIIEGAAWAPFHKKADEKTHRAGEMNAAMPWRFHVLDSAACMQLIDYLGAQAEVHPESKWSRAWQSKIKNMLAGCDVLIQATWLPDPSDDSTSPEMTMGNIEHIAAASAAVQNVLLAAESKGWYSYWSSGGILRDAELLEHLGVAPGEALLGSVFLSSSLADNAKVLQGGLREERGAPDTWVRWV